MATGRPGDAPRLRARAEHGRTILVVGPGGWSAGASASRALRDARRGATASGVPLDERVYLVVDAPAGARMTRHGMLQLPEHGDARVLAYVDEYGRVLRGSTTHRTRD